jgi:uncharacterized protein YjbJ (UPF0337 family)
MKERRPLNWDQMEGAWKQRRGKAVQHWGKLMNDELAAIAGKYEELVGKLQEKYGIASDRSEHQRDDFKRIFEELKRSNARLVSLQTRRETGKPATKRAASRTTASKRRRSTKNS